MKDNQFVNVNSFLFECIFNNNFEGVKIAIANGVDLSKQIGEVYTKDLFVEPCTVFEAAIDITQKYNYNLITEYLESEYKRTR